MNIREQIIEILKENPNLSCKEIGKVLNKSRSTIAFHLKKLNIVRDRNEIRKLNNNIRSYPIKITDNAHQIILGSILGDGYISKISRNENSKLNLNSCLRIKHSLKQKAYCLYKQSLLEKENIIIYTKEKLPNQKICFIENRQIKDNGSFELITQKNISINFYRNEFYNSEKIITDKIFDLKPLGLAIWYMDDGSKHKSSYYLHTDGFNIESQQILIKMLYKNFNIKSVLHKTKSNYNIYIKQESKDLFTNLIKEFICDNMLYKLHNLGRVKQSELLEPPKMKLDEK